MMRSVSGNPVENFVLDGVSYDTILIDELPFLIPTTLRRFERNIKQRLQDVVALLKEKSWYDYVLMSDIVIVVIPSHPKGKFGILCGGNSNIHRRAYFVDSGQVMNASPEWVASVLVHEATHVFQRHYLPHKVRNDRRTMEEDACREQIAFLKQCKGKAKTIVHIRKQLKKPRGWWKYLDSGPKTKLERYNCKRLAICRRMLDDLIPHISF